MLNCVETERHNFGGLTVTVAFGHIQGSEQCAYSLVGRLHADLGLDFVSFRRVLRDSH